MTIRVKMRYLHFKLFYVALVSFVWKWSKCCLYKLYYKIIIDFNKHLTSEFTVVVQWPNLRIYRIHIWVGLTGWLQIWLQVSLPSCKRFCKACTVPLLLFAFGSRVCFPSPQTVLAMQLAGESRKCWGSWTVGLRD